MSQAFIYNNPKFADLDLADDVYDGTWAVVYTFTPNQGGDVANRERVYDQSLDSDVAFDAQDTIRFDFGTGGIVAANDTNLAVYCSQAPAAQRECFLFATVSHATDIDADAPGKTINITAAGWNIFSFAAFGSDRKYLFFLNDQFNTLNNVSEMVFGRKYTFDQDPTDNTYVEDEVNAVTRTRYNADKKGDLRKHWKWEWTNLDDTMKSNLESFQSDVEGNFRKFLYTPDETNYYWVRMTANSLQFKKQTYGRWNTNIELFEQLI